MPDAFTQLGFSDVTRRIIEDSIPQYKSVNDTVSGYFVGQCASMLIRELVGNKLASDSMNFNKKLQQVKEEAKSGQHDAELKFMREFQKQSLRNHIECSRQINQSRHQLREFSHLCDDWNNTFALDIGPILEEHSEITNEKPSPNIRIIMARTPLTEQVFANGVDARNNYFHFCDKLRGFIISENGLKTDFIPAWKECSRNMFSETMKLFYIMQGIPSIVFFPVKKNSDVIIHYAFWALAPGLDNLKFDSFRLNDNNVIIPAIYSICAYVRDCFRLFVCQCKPYGIKSGATSNSVLLDNWVRSKYSELNDIGRQNHLFDLNVINN